MKTFTITGVLVLALLSLAPAVASAATNVSFPYWGHDPALVECAQSGNPGQDCNFCELVALVQKLIYFALTILLFVIAPILFGIAGFYVLVDLGSEERMRQGRKIFTGTVWGIGIGLVSFVLVNLFLGILLGSSWSWSSIQCT